MGDLATWLAEHGTTVVALVAALRAIWRARALRDEAAARAVSAVVDRLEAAEAERATCEERCAALEVRMRDAEGRVHDAEERAGAAEKMSAALARELEDLMRAVGASAGKD